MSLEAAIDSLAVTVLQVKAERDRYRKALEMILEEARERQDIIDGANGPLPDIWMCIAQQIEEVL
jgi:hypothetical protein